jgi:hypothetical protein
MSHKTVPSVCFVIDASIARAAGPPESKHPTGMLCREFLQKIRSICRRVAWNDSIKAEWEKHQSAFARTWFVSMFNLRKVRLVPNETDERFREAIRGHSSDAGVVEAMLKDAHLIEAALATNRRIAALDQTVRGHFGRMTATYSSLLQIVWVNPVLEGVTCFEWLESGAVEEPDRQLRPPIVG